MGERPTSIRVDPEGHEIDALLRLAGDLSAARVLEVGCGDGRLTRRYAAGAAQVVAIDPDPAAIATARAQLAPGLHSTVKFQATDIESLDRSVGPFDLVIMSWSL